MITSTESDYLKGIAKLEDKLIILLDLDKVLAILKGSDLTEMEAIDETLVPEAV
jgi:chemotaxis signal transduction protein